MRKFTAALVTASLFFGGAGVAVADSWHPLKEPFTTTGAKFQSVEYKWEPPGEKRGAFRFRGVLRDTNDRDGHNVYLQAKAHDYRWQRFDGVQKRSISIEKTVHDGATRYTNTADMRVCRNRGSLRPDNCSHTRTFRR
ncbi:hypothetical protein GCM10010497_40670 [Streptomyces cinereoruber]|uniref:Uncharacterized protein n=1 Tax=Streptomyces cinereoruber TaxID=67260 RepID=A0AAV4KP60_9ACTN|nr:hypothetical protein [Streptomyces cinereoruber]QEV36897.1 hypothetical protein CP977_18210 [Streptomyces cinereoruber]GGR33747.1 hypothetical protein GCM10010497_40670 [Streptomyces cinereoruber]